jgi:hypothetical protein
MIKLNLTLLLLIAGLSTMQAQVKIGNNPTAINSNSMLELETTDKGMLMPRVALAATDNANPLSSHIEGMTVYNTAVSGTGNTVVTPGFYYNDGTQWVRLQSQTNYAGDLKQSFLTADHNGWYLLNGRAIGTLPATAQSAAIALGFSTSLPDAADRVLKTTNGSEAMAVTGGANNLSIDQANLPNLNLAGTITGTTTSDGDHNHTGTTSSAGAHTHASTAGSGFLLGGTSINNNGSGQYNSNTGGVASAWGGVGLSGTTASAGNHTHTYTSNTTGDHSHTVTGTASVSTGGSGTVLDNRSPFLVVNTFIYLGQ